MCHICAGNKLYGCPLLCMAFIILLRVLVHTCSMYMHVCAAMQGIALFQGDVQTSVSILIVLNELGKQLVPESLIKQWFSTYIGKFLYAVHGNGH